ncbi:helix-turn-helix transcriptional regulator [Stenotrophomonas acidaminiphila]|uniref:helix-turn-helix transcriptional regulator n=1 Tax=Stenotrophomonas acidaminiphila TaxID=128780 RepID=UPI0028A682F9|nr:WYL domain-containing protein [Stenotrophomonas acidaminiphila]
MSANTLDTLQRQWEMLRLLPRAPSKITVAQIKQRLELQNLSADSRTLQRDLQNLSSRFPLTVDGSSKPYGWSWSRDANIEFTPRLSTSQGVALLLAQEHLRQFLPKILLNELVPFFDFAKQELANSGWENWHKRTAILPTSLPLLPPKVSADVLDAVHLALAKKTCLRGTYHAKGGKAAKEMKIHPLGLLVRGSVQYLICTLRDYKDIKHLALHRLSTVITLDEPAVAPEGFDFAGYVATTGSKYHAQGQIRLVARFEAETIEHLRDTPVSIDQQMSEPDPEGWATLTATLDSDETLRWWLLGFGSRVEVIEPEDLRQELAMELAGAAGRYRRAEQPG